MRRILCEKCLRGHLPAGVRKIRGALQNEPAEHQRLVLGTALDPTEEQRTVYLNGEPTARRTATVRPQNVCSAKRKRGPYDW